MVEVLKTKSIVDLIGEMKRQGVSRKEENEAIAAEMSKLDVLRKEIESQGGDAEKNKDFNKQKLKLDKRQFQLSLKTMSPAAKKEALKEQAGKDKKQLTVLQRLNQGILGLGGSLKESAQGAVGGMFGFLKKAAMIALIFLLPKILNSQFAKDTVKFLEEKIPIVFEKLKNLFTRIKDGFGPLINFAKDPSFTNFKELFNADTGIAAGFAVLTAMFLPFGVGRIVRSVLGKAIVGLIGGLGKLAGGLTMMTANMLLGGGDKDKDKDKKTKKTTKKATKGLKGFSKIGKIAKIGARAIPGVGLIATAAFGIFDGVVAGLEEAKKETATVGSIARESVSGVLSGLTFGLVSQETISKGFQNLGTKFEEGANFLKDGFNTGLEFIKGARIPTMEEVGEGITTAGLAIKGAYAKVGGKLLETKDMLTKSFEDVTGINLPEFGDVTNKLKEFGNNLKERALSFIPSKESILKFGGKIKNFVADKLEGSEKQQDKIKQAVDDALKLHFETDHVADKIQENAMNKYQDSSAAASPVLVSNNSSSNNTNNYASYSPRVTANDTSTMHIIEQR